MNDTQRKELVALVLEHDVPVRMTRNGERYYIDGAPEPFGRTFTGWRFRGTTAEGDSHLFEVVSGGRARWNLRAVRD
jgi:hypothetical protein